MGKGLIGVALWAVAILAQPLAWGSLGPSPLLGDLAFTLPGAERPAEAFPDCEPALVPGPRVFVASLFQQRLRAISGFRLEDVVAKPGHRVVRDPSKVFELAETIRRDGYRVAEKLEDRIALNVLTSASGRVLGVDAWDGHHRILALMLNGAKTVDDLARQSSGELRLFVRGADEPGRPAPRYKLPAAALDFQSQSAWQTLDGRPYVIRADKPPRSGELLLSPALSNREVGSRDTLGMVLDHLRAQSPPKVAIWRLKREELPVPSALTAARAAGVSDLVFVLETGAPDSALRAAVNTLKVPGLRVNLYQGFHPYGEYVALFGEASFRYRLQQIYATTLSVADLTP